MGLGRGANLETRDAHDVRVERLGVLGAEGLVRGGAAGADDGHRHLELPPVVAKVLPAEDSSAMP